MTDLYSNILSQDIISEYWRDFLSGGAPNIYLSQLRNQKNESWCTKDAWVRHAKKCIEKNTDIIGALEVLLIEEKEAYLEFAESIVSEFHKNDGYDVDYYFNIIAKLPKNNLYRKEYFSPNSFIEYLKTTTWESDCRKALIYAEDECFVEFLGVSINQKLSAKTISYDEMEDDILPLLMDLGRNSLEYVTKENLERVKGFCLTCLEKDKILHDERLNGTNYEDRWYWVLYDIAYYAWVLNWDDVIQTLVNKEWYWLSLFDIDMYNENLLVWSSLLSNDILKNRAIYVMNHSEHNKIDGAIAWERLCTQRANTPIENPIKTVTSQPDFGR